MKRWELPVRLSQDVRILRFQEAHQFEAVDIRHENVENDHFELIVTSGSARN